jgi:hypothetical protein
MLCQDILRVDLAPATVVYLYLKPAGGGCMPRTMISASCRGPHAGMQSAEHALDSAQGDSGIAPP